MENQSEKSNHHHLLNLLLKQPFHPLYSNLPLLKQQIQSLPYLSNNFFAKFEKSFFCLKIALVQLLRQFNDRLQKQEAELLSEWLDGLNDDAEYMLKEGIMNLYLSFCQLRKQSTISEQLMTIRKEVCRLLEKPLRFFFIYHEFQEKERKGKPKSKQFFSNKSIENKVGSKRSLPKIQEKQEILVQITENLSTMKISELFSQYVEAQERKIENAYEVCRICSMKVKLNEVQRHLSYCSTISTLNQRLNEIQEEGEGLVQEMKEKQRSIYQKDFKSQKQKELLHIYCGLQAYFLKNKKLKKYSNKENQGLELRRQIEIYMANYDEEEDELTKKFLTLIENHFFTTKKRQSFELNYLHNSESNDGNSLKSLKSLSESLGDFKMIFSHNEKTKKSIFFTKKSSSSYKSASEKAFEDFSNKKIEKKINKLSQSTRKEKKKVKFDLDSEDSLSHQRKCVSLTNIEISTEEDSKSISLKNFEIIKFLGKGAFGKVYLAKRRQTNNLYALKIIKIEQNWGEKELEQIKNQHQIFKKIAGAHLVTAPFSFNDRMGHCFVLEFMPGGDLGQILAEAVYLEEEEAKFYLAQIVLAIEHLHKFGIIHRDLKPENLVVDEKGHLKLTDFGLSQIRISDKLKKVKEIKTNFDQSQSSKSPVSRFAHKKSHIRLIGTPDYIAPEIIKKISFDNMSIDWWSFGVIAYEMMIGCRPFCADTIEEVIDNIQNYRIEWPEIGSGEGQISEKAVDLIKQLLNMNYEERLGAKNVNEIKNHEFFEGINWDTLKDTKPPLDQEIEDHEKYEQFEEDPELRREVNQLIKKKELQRDSQLKLQNFIRVDLLAEETFESAEKESKKNDQKLKVLRRISQKFPKKKLEYRRTSLQFQVEDFCSLKK